MKTLFDWLIKLVIARVKDYVVRNWKTTLAGVLGALLTRYIPDPATREAALAAIVALIGVLAKDGDTTGTTEQPRDPEPVPEPSVVTLGKSPDDPGSAGG